MKDLRRDRRTLRSRRASREALNRIAATPVANAPRRVLCRNPRHKPRLSTCTNASLRTARVFITPVAQSIGVAHVREKQSHFGRNAHEVCPPSVHRQEAQLRQEFSYSAVQESFQSGNAESPHVPAVGRLNESAPSPQAFRRCIEPDTTPARKQCATALPHGCRHRPGLPSRAGSLLLSPHSQSSECKRRWPNDAPRNHPRHRNSFRL